MEEIESNWYVLHRDSPKAKIQKYKSVGTFQNVFEQLHSPKFTKINSKTPTSAKSPCSYQWPIKNFSPEKIYEVENQVEKILEVKKVRTDNAVYKRLYEEGTQRSNDFNRKQ